MQNTTAPENSSINQQSEEISLRDIVQFLKEGRRWIISTFIGFILIGIAYLSFAPPKYDAFANITMASVADKAVEGPDILGEKLKLPLFYSNDTLTACNVQNERPTPGQFLAENLNRAINKNAPIVSINFRGASPELAKQCLEAVISDIRRNQNILSKPILDAKKSQVLLLQEKINSAEKLAAKLPITQLKFNFDDPKFSASALLWATIIGKESEVKDLRAQLHDLQITLTEPQTRETALVTPIYAPPIKAAPKATLVLLSSAIAGLFIGMLLWAIRKMFFK